MSTVTETTDYQLLKRQYTHTTHTHTGPFGRRTGMPDRPQMTQRQRSTYSQLARDKRPLRSNKCSQPRPSTAPLAGWMNRLYINALDIRNFFLIFTFSLSCPSLNHNGVLHDILQIHSHGWCRFLNGEMVSEAWQSARRLRHGANYTTTVQYGRQQQRQQTVQYNTSANSKTQLIKSSTTTVLVRSSSDSLLSQTLMLSQSYIITAN